MLLFLYWDLECYLEGEDNLKDTFKINIEYLDF